MLRTVGLALAVSLAVFACSSGSTGGIGLADGGASGEGGAEAGNGGTTSCGPQTCQPSTYCLNGNCSLGCLGDGNCTSAEVCVKASGESVGACERTATVPPPSGSADASASRDGG